MQKKALRTAGWIFLVMALVHALRVLFHVRITVQDYHVSQGVSLIAVVVLILLAGWMFYTAR